ncbi:MAG: VPS9 domain-containing protein [Candidatus Pacebacteria bacterium]|nr:VPS9 domain-containing protein [Candidatus Paceibacterota bacterium]
MQKPDPGTDVDLGFDFQTNRKTDIESRMMKAGPGIKHSKTIAATNSTATASAAAGVTFSPETRSLRAFVESLDKFLRRDTNPFNVLIAEFKRLFVAEFTARLGTFGAGVYEDYKNNFATAKDKKVFTPKKRDQLCSATRGALGNIQVFVSMLVRSLDLIYEPIIRPERAAQFRDLIINSLMDILIRDEIYEVLFMLIRLEDQAEEVLVTKKIRELQFVRPEYLGVNEYFCLNEASRIVDVAGDFRAGLRPATGEEWNKCSLEQAPNEEELRFREKGNNYQPAIDKLKEVTKHNTPIQKLQCITGLNSVICKCVDEFWRGVPVAGKNLSLNADQYLCILIYLIVKARVPNLFTHIALANEFAMLGSRSSYNAYCLNTLHACFYHLLNVEPRCAIVGPSKTEARGKERRTFIGDPAAAALPVEAAETQKSRKYSG